MATGRVLQFDGARGYGFVAADDGGEDIFLHASVFEGDPEELVPGTKVAFKVMAGDRGRKAFAAYLADDEAGPVPAPRQAPPVVPSPAPAPLTPAPAPLPAPPAALHAPAPLTPVPAPAAALPAPAQGDEQDDEQMCDVLSQAEFGQELTELLLERASSLTGRQIVEIRQAVLESARKHGWVDI